MSPSNHRLRPGNPNATEEQTQAQQHPLNTSDDIPDPELRRARPRSRSPHVVRQNPWSPHAETETPQSATTGAEMADPTSATARRNIPSDIFSAFPSPPAQNDHLSPSSALGMGTAYWRGLSRSPSPLGLIPIHREWRQFIHKHEIPRKALHVSIGFFVLFFYLRGYHVADASSGLIKFLLPIASVDFVRMRFPPLNRLYIRFLGAFMREAEAHDRYNGVIPYMAGALFVILATPADVAIMSIVCLSWCDTAASTVGRLYGRYTPRIRKGKSLAGSMAAFSLGVVIALLFWGFVAHQPPPHHNTGAHSFAFTGTLLLPAPLGRLLGSSSHLGSRAVVEGPLALALVSLWSGLVVSASEAIDLWGLDDNLTIPVLYGAVMSASLKACT